jgi:hypothetical protein
VCARDAAPGCLHLDATRVNLPTLSWLLLTRFEGVGIVLDTVTQRVAVIYNVLIKYLFRSSGRQTVYIDAAYVYFLRVVWYSLVPFVVVVFSKGRMVLAELKLVKFDVFY